MQSKPLTKQQMYERLKIIAAMVNDLAKEMQRSFEMGPELFELIRLKQSKDHKYFIPIKNDIHKPK